MNLLGSCGLCHPMLRMAHNWATSEGERHDDDGIIYDSDLIG